VELTTNQKGAIAEAAITKRAVELGVEVYRPAVEGGRYDLIFALEEILLRVQCKWASKYENALLIRCYSCRRAREGMRVRRYTVAEVDVIAAYSSDTGHCYYLPAPLWSGVGECISGSGRRATTSRQGSTGPVITSSALHFGGSRGP
jgi:PD-(D/E)XK endonuclease